MKRGAVRSGGGTYGVSIELEVAVDDDKAFRSTIAPRSSEVRVGRAGLGELSDWVAKRVMASEVWDFEGVDSVRVTSVTVTFTE